MKKVVCEDVITTKDADRSLRGRVDIIACHTKHIVEVPCLKTYANPAPVVCILQLNDDDDYFWSELFNPDIILDEQKFSTIDKAIGYIENSCVKSVYFFNDEVEFLVWCTGKLARERNEGNKENKS